MIDTIQIHDIVRLTNDKGRSREAVVTHIRPELLNVWIGILPDGRIYKFGIRSNPVVIGHAPDDHPALLANAQIRAEKLITRGHRIARVVCEQGRNAGDKTFTIGDAAMSVFGEFIETVARILNLLKIHPRSFENGDKFLNGVFAAWEQEIHFEEMGCKGTVYWEAGAWYTEVFWPDNQRKET
jgi:hypothetical protein